MSADELEAIKSSLHRIETALVGDPTLGNTGIVARLASVETKAEAMDKKQLVWGGVVTGASLALGTLKDKLFS